MEMTEEKRTQITLLDDALKVVVDAPAAAGDGLDAAELKTVVAGPEEVALQGRNDLAIARIELEHYREPFR